MTNLGRGNRALRGGRHWLQAVGLSLMLALSPNWAIAQQGFDSETGEAVSSLALSAAFVQGGAPVHANLHWRVFRARARDDGSHPLVAESKLSAPQLSLPPGNYIVHVAYGLASAMGNVELGSSAQQMELYLKAGALDIKCVVGDSEIDASHVDLSIYASEPRNLQAKLVMAHARAGSLIGLPEGNYDVVSTYLDHSGLGGVKDAQGVPSNSVVSASLSVQVGKITEATLRHRFATVTMKLVNKPGGEALANTSFAILTPGGDPIRDLIGAFPAVVLAEGEYDAIARNNGKTYEGTFKVDSNINRDVEIIAK
ncbi:MAG: hypothetical protein KGQ46_09555 [Hyphomicrobiales bacterium]|nr:hypothetical protein [Hyphomicrobiales bacterium]MDE2116004.1 hypothetical protein [Hyphomicrobiales bacterium]